MQCNLNNVEHKKDDLLECLNKNLKSEDNLQRADTVEQVEDLLNNILEKILKLSNDRDELVQVSSLEVMDNIILFCNKLPFYLKTLLNSKSWLVRAYAIEALGDLNDVSSKKILQNMLSMADEEELSRLYYALIKMGDKEYFNQLYDLLNSDFYRVKIATATLLEKLISDNTRQEITEKIKNRLAIEKEKSVIDRLTSILSDNERRLRFR